MSNRLTVDEMRQNGMHVPGFAAGHYNNDAADADEGSETDDAALLREMQQQQHNASVVQPVENNKPARAKKQLFDDVEEEEDEDLPIFGQLSRTDFKRLREAALSRLSEADANRISMIMDDDPAMWQFMFMYIFGGQSHVAQKIDAYYRKADEFADLLKHAEQVNQARFKQTTALVNAINEHATKAEQRIENYHQKAVAYVVGRTAGSISEKLKLEVAKGANEAMEKALKGNMLGVILASLFGCVASMAIGVLGAFLFMRF